MRHNDLFTRCGIPAALVFGLYAVAQAQQETATSAGTVRSYSTIHCIGIKWHLAALAEDWL